MFDLSSEDSISDPEALSSGLTSTSLDLKAAAKMITGGEFPIITLDLNLQASEIIVKASE